MQRREMKITDFDRFNELLSELNQHVGLSSANPLWAEIEAIKNRNAGMPPKADKTYVKTLEWKSLKEINAMMPGSVITPNHPGFAKIMMRRCALHYRQDIHPEFVGTLEQRGKSATKYLRWAIEYRDISRRNQQLKRKGI